MATSNTATTLQAIVNLRSDASTASYAGDVTKGINYVFPSLQQASVPGPYMRTGSSLTVTANASSTLYLYGIPGDVPALPRLTLSDVSTNSKIIQDWHIGQRSADALRDADFQPWLTVTPESGRQHDGQRRGE